MTDPLGKYHVPDDEAEILPNLLGLTTRDEIDEMETEGIYEAETVIIEELSDQTYFDLRYIYRIHEIAFSRLYSFAGKLRTVDISKDGFRFPAAKFLPDTMRAFEEDILSKLPKSYSDTLGMIRDIATVHAELLFIHPFREGNGRVARILANAMALRYAGRILDFELIGKERFEEYILAVQAAAGKDYKPMKEIMRLIF